MASNITNTTSGPANVELIDDSGVQMTPTRGSPIPAAQDAIRDSVPWDTTGAAQDEDSSYELVEAQSEEPQSPSLSFSQRQIKYLQAEERADQEALESAFEFSDKMKAAVQQGKKMQEEQRHVDLVTRILFSAL